MMGEVTDMPLVSHAEVASAGGKARAKKLSAERRREIAKEASNQRWHPPAVKPGPAPVLHQAVRPRDDEIRQHHGVATTMGATNSTVRCWENEQTVGIRVYNGVTGTEEKVTPAAARYLADQLYLLAGRIDRRAGK